MKKTILIKMKSLIAFFFAISSISIGFVSAHPHHPEQMETEQQILDEEIIPVSINKETPHTH